MPRNKFGGNRAKGMKNKRPPKPLIYKKDAIGCIYGCIVSNMGNGACAVNIIKQDGLEESETPLRCKIRGSVRRQRFLKGEIVLICKEELTTNGQTNYDIVHKYNADHTQELIKRGEIITTSKNSSFGVSFDEDEIDEDEDEYIDDTNDNIFTKTLNVGTYANPMPSLAENDDVYEENTQQYDHVSKSNEIEFESNSDTELECDKFGNTILKAKTTVGFDAYLSPPTERKLTKSTEKKSQIIKNKKGKFGIQKQRDKKDEEFDGNIDNI